MTNNTRIPTPSELENMKRKITLLRSIAGTNTDTALAVLSYTMIDVVVENDIALHSLIQNLCSIYGRRVFIEHGNDEGDE